MNFRHKKIPARLLPLIAVIVLVRLYQQNPDIVHFFFSSEAHEAAEHSVPTISAEQSDQIMEAIHRRASDVNVSFSAIVVKVLPDDNEGSRHQRFIVRLHSGSTVLISHNIDLAPRVEHLAAGDQVRVSGQFEWNDKGGVVHWTHHDPNHRRSGGWIKYKDKLYQ